MNLIKVEFGESAVKIAKQEWVRIKGKILEKRSRVVDNKSDSGVSPTFREVDDSSRVRNFYLILGVMAVLAVVFFIVFILGGKDTVLPYRILKIAETSKDQPYDFYIIAVLNVKKIPIDEQIVSTLKEIVSEYRRKRKVGRIELLLPDMKEGEGAFAAAIFSGRNLRYHVINHSVIDLWEQGFYNKK
ncbi:hypothetical protein [Kosmotoga sp.]|uniref:hypothetical protein n=1 Tax=Kosmotoga sp. TaxID=1955248 RepID=UPI00258C204A|nr:hypothetical protein [Kosmotoga sp.]